MKQRALDILAKLTRERVVTEARLTDLLRDPESDAIPDWFLHVPKCFNDALDIKRTARTVEGVAKTTWTQGALFAFKAGDILYDTGRAYEDWRVALRHIGVAVQVRSGASATSPLIGMARSSGSVTFDVLVPSADRNNLVPSGCQTLTQYEFVRLLITGDGLAHERA